MLERDAELGCGLCGRPLSRDRGVNADRVDRVGVGSGERVECDAVRRRRPGEGFVAAAVGVEQAAAVLVQSLHGGCW